MREVAFDTETTGLEPRDGERIIEVGCVELHNYIETGREFQIYINPERPLSEASVRITGLTDDFLRDKKTFSHPDVVDRLMEFLGDDPIVAHNAEFDRGFLNAELKRLGRATLPKDRFIDTIPLARAHRPGSPASLDAVCKRFNISIEDRELHGALKDARLLAKAYLELRGGKERKFEFSDSTGGMGAGQKQVVRQPRPTPLPPRISEAEIKAHAAFVETLGESAIWRKYS